MKELGDELVGDVFAGTEIIFHLKNDKPLDEKVVKAALTKHKVKSKGKLKKDKTYIL